MSDNKSPDENSSSDSISEEKSGNSNGSENSAKSGDSLNLLQSYFVKLGNSQIFNKEGLVFGVTVLRALPSCSLGPTSSKNGKVKVGFIPVEKSQLNKPRSNSFKGLESAYKLVRELPLAQSNQAEAGKVTSLNLEEGSKVNVFGKSKGKGFQGVMKRFNFSGIVASHGAGPVHRSPGSIGCRTDPGRVMKNRKLPGRMGTDNICIKNVKVLKLDGDIVFINGSVPGGVGSIVKLEKVGA